MESRFPDLQPLVGSGKYLLQEQLDSDSPEAFLALDPKGFPYLVRLFRDLPEDKLARLSRALVPFEHPHVVGFTDSGLGTDHGWLARPFLEGVRLESKLGEGDFSPEEVVEFLLHLLEGLEALHAEGFMYDNWRPENILRHQERWLLCDFGLRHWLDPSVGAYYPRMQKWAYIAPEKITSNQPNQHSDLYSLGAVGYHCLSGEPLFMETDEPMKFLMSVLTEEPRIKERCPKAPEHLVEALEIMLGKEPEQRDAEEVRSLLEGGTRVHRAATPQVEGFLAEMKQGGQGCEAGEFTLDPRRALEKLRDFQFPRAHHFLFPLIAGMVAGRAGEVKIKASKSRLVLRADADPLSREQLEGIFLAATRKDGSVSHLGMGLIGALGAGARRVSVKSEVCKAGISCISEQVRVEGHRGSGILVEIEGDMVGAQAHPELLSRFMFSRTKIWWNGTVLNPDHHLEEWGCRWQESEGFQIEGALWARAPGLYLQVDGLTFQLSTSFVLPRALVVISGPWRLSLAYQLVRGDERRAELKSLARELLLRKAAPFALEHELITNVAEFYRAFLREIPADLLEECLKESTSRT